MRPANSSEGSPRAAHRRKRPAGVQKENSPGVRSPVRCRVGIVGTKVAEQKGLCGKPKSGRTKLEFGVSVLKRVPRCPPFMRSCANHTGGCAQVSLNCGCARMQRECRRRLSCPYHSSFWGASGTLAVRTAVFRCVVRSRRRDYSKSEAVSRNFDQILAFSIHWGPTRTRLPSPPSPPSRDRSVSHQESVSLARKPFQSRMPFVPSA